MRHPTTVHMVLVGVDKLQSVYTDHRGNETFINMKYLIIDAANNAPNARGMFDVTKPVGPEPMDKWLTDYLNGED